MKKTVKVLSLALVAMAFAVACNNNKTPEEPIDTIVPVDTVVEELIDTTAVEEVVVDEPVKQAAPAKKKAKKEQPKAEVKVDASKMTIKTKNGGSVSAGNGSLTIKQ